MQLLDRPPSDLFKTPNTPIRPFPRPQQVRTSAPWPFYVQAPRQLSCDIQANALRVLETTARYFFSASAGG